MQVVDRKARWREDVVTQVIEVPVWDEEIKPSLFYTKMDYFDFQEAEQRRYDKMMAKQIQKMVYEKMGPQLQEAMDRGASAEEIEAMLPQTTEAIFALLGSIPRSEIPAHLKSDNSESVRKAVPKQKNGEQDQEICSHGEFEQDIGGLDKQPKSESIQLASSFEGDSSCDVGGRQDVETSSEFPRQDDRISTAQSTAVPDASEEDSCACSRINAPPRDRESILERQDAQTDSKADAPERWASESGYPSFPNDDDPMETEGQSFNNKEADATEYATTTLDKAHSKRSDEIKFPFFEEMQNYATLVTDQGQPASNNNEASSAILGDRHTGEQRIVESYSKTEEVRRERSEQRLQALRQKLMKMTEGHDDM